MSMLNPRNAAVWFLDTFRWGPSLCITMTILTGVALSYPDIEPFRFALTTAVVVLGFTNVNLFNYFTDLEEDKINGRYNPVNNPWRRFVGISYLAASATAVLLICYRFFSIHVFWASLVGLVTGYVYSSNTFRFKEKLLVKNFTIGFGYGLVLLIVTGSLTAITTTDVFLAVYFGFFSVEGSTIRDVFDVNGDRVANVTTVPVVLGTKRTAYFLVAVVICQLAAVAVPAYVGIIPTEYLLLVATLPLLLKWPYFLYTGQIQRINPRGIPGIVATTGIVLLLNTLW